MREILITCPKCGEPQLFREGKYDIAVDCTCEKQARVTRKLSKFKNMSITARNNSSDIFKNADYTVPADQKILAKMQKYADNFHKAQADNVGLLLTGTPGTGKTFYANCISNFIQEKGYSVLSFNLSGYLRKIQEGYDKKEVSAEDKLLQAVKEVDLLFIDDLGSEKLSEWGIEKVYNLIDERYRAKKPIIITTNLDKRGLEHQLDLNGSDKLLDRIAEMTVPFIFDWESRRKQKKNTDLWN